MEKPSKRGKIPQQDWPSIIARHESGETLASIARTYDCSPPAISYIVSRSRARQSANEPPILPPSPPEPQLIKTHPTGMPAADTTVPAAAVPAAAPPAAASPATPPQPAEAAAMPRPHEDNGAAERSGAAPAEPHPGGNGAAFAGRNQPPPPANGDARRTLHLSLGNGGGSRQPYNPPSASPPGPSERYAPRQGQDRFERPPAERREPIFSPPPVNTAPAMAEPPTARNGGGGTFLDHALRERVEGDITAFLAAFDAALAGDTVESRAELREATDRLLRAGARTRIELERLEARAPLPPRDRGGQPAQSWRPR